MNILLNNRPETFDTDTMSIRDLLNQKNFTFKMLVIKINQNLVRPPDYDTTFINDGDDVMVLHLISGG